MFPVQPLLLTHPPFFMQKEETAAYKEERQQLHQELKKLQKDQEQSRLEIRSLQKELQQLRSQAQLQEQLHRDTLQSQAAQEQELAFLLRDRQQLISVLEQRWQEIRSLQKELQQLRSQAQLQEQLHRDTLQSQAAQEQELAFLLRDRQQLISVLEQRWQEVCSLQEELQQLRSQAQHWEMLHRDREQTLAMMQEELAVCKLELAFLKQDRQQLLSDLKQSPQEIRSLQEELQKLISQSQHCQKLHWDTLQSQAAQEQELDFLLRDRQQLISVLEQRWQEVCSLQEDLIKLSVRAENWEQLQFYSLESQTKQKEELAFLLRDRQQLRSGQEQCHQEVCSLQEDLKKLSIRTENWEQLQSDALESQTAQEEELAFFRQERQQLLSGQEQCRQEVCSLQEDLKKLSIRAENWEMLHQDREQTLAMMKEELAVCKAELVSFEGELRKIGEQLQDTNTMRTNLSPRAEGARPEPQAPQEEGSVQGSLCLLLTSRLRSVTRHRKR
ncbi:hypothetical protein ASZ78_002221 [Callipepla squamata]|uniref:Uncharacterized protein n=1 Tax=Callipepla squamata TaxID=9009 RepID=A0A226NM14_CALSU|nr:hypothetical protein ASZ78_002221 [Callipepla squamata]